jgi:rhamnogalacturonan endolyase
MGSPMKAINHLFLYVFKAGRKRTSSGASFVLHMNRIFVICAIVAFMGKVYGQYQIETLDRGIVAIKTSDTSVFISWRLLATDPDSISFNVYRGSTKLNELPVTNSTNYIDSNGTSLDTYHVMPVLGGIEQAGSDTVQPWTTNYHSIPLQKPAEGTVPGGATYTYSANDCSIGDLDGDGKYEIILKWDPSNSKDNSQSGYTGNVLLDAYELDGTLLWRIDLGINIRAGAHYTQLMVYDLDGDGKAEVACKTAPGTKDASGNYLKLGPAATADHTKDYRNTSGYVLSGPEYMTIFNGETGMELVTTDYIPQRGTVASWGDTYGNRVDRFLACIAYLDGSRPSLVMCRGYYTGDGRGRTVLAAWDYRDNILTNRWTFNADLTGENPTYTGQGNHNLSVGDVDGDGKDEIIYGACAIDDDGTGLWTTGLGHGDAMHLSDIDPNRPGLEVFGIHEGTNTPGSALLDARTGEILWKTPNTDAGRGVSADLVASEPGMECWGGTDGLVNAKNVRVGSAPGSSNFVIWWDGDLTRELLDDIFIDKYGQSILLIANGCASNNGTKATPGLQADILGDWREEVIWRKSDNTELRLYTTTWPTSYRMPTLMHDHMYRLGIAWQNVAYNQPPHLGFFLSPEALLPDSLRPPSPPYGLYARALNDTVKLKWNVNTETDLAGYNLYRATGSKENFIKLNDTLLLENAFTDTAVINDVTYYYAVTATDTLGNESRYSDVVKAIPTIRPAAPTGLYARNDDKKVKLFWDAYTSGPIAGYNIYRSKTSLSNYAKINSELVTLNEFQNSNMTNNIPYYFMITAVDNNSLESFFTDEIAVTPGPVTYLQEDEGIVSGGSIDNNNLGFHGTGFYNFATNNSTIDFIHIGGNLGGNYMLVYRYALGNTNRTGSLVINGTSQSLTMKSTGEWTTYVYDSVVISLNEGFTNTIGFAATGSDFGNLDEIIVKPTTLSVLHDLPVDRATAFSAIYPNPFRNQVSINYHVNESCRISIHILNLTGETVRTLVHAIHYPGYYEVKWDARDESGKTVPGGVYFCRLMVENGVYETKKIVVMH